MRQRLTEEEWNELSPEQQRRVVGGIGITDPQQWRNISPTTLGELIEFLHSTEYDLKIEFEKKRLIASPDQSKEYLCLEKNMWRIRIVEEGLVYKDKELILAVFKAAKDLLKETLSNEC